MNRRYRTLLARHARALLLLLGVSAAVASEAASDCPPIVHLVDRTLESRQLVELLTFRDSEAGRCLRSGQLVVFDDVVTGVDDAADDLAWQRLIPPIGSSLEVRAPMKANMAVGLERATHAVSELPDGATGRPRVVLYGRLTLGMVAEATVRYRQWLDRVVLPELIEQQAALFVLEGDSNSRVLAGSLFDRATGVQRVGFDAPDGWQKVLKRWLDTSAPPVALPPVATPPAILSIGPGNGPRSGQQASAGVQRVVDDTDTGLPGLLWFALAAVGLLLLGAAFVFLYRRRQPRRPLGRSRASSTITGMPRGTGETETDAQPTRSRYRPLHDHPGGSETALTEELSSWELPPEQFHTKR